MTGQIVLISGTSGSGKTTTCANFARRAEQPWLTFGMDLLVGTLFPDRGRSLHVDFQNDANAVVAVAIHFVMESPVTGAMNLSPFQEFPSLHRRRKALRSPEMVMLAVDFSGAPCPGSSRHGQM